MDDFYRCTVDLSHALSHTILFLIFFCSIYNSDYCKMQNFLEWFFREILNKMSRAGTTLVEVKSGYGLDTETEIKMLTVVEEAKKDPNVKVDISSTYCGAHAVPR